MTCRKSRGSTEYGERRAIFYAKHPEDRRLKRKFAGESREKERVKQALNRVSKAIVEKAKVENSAIVMERLKHFMSSQRRGNGMGRTFRGRLNRWPFGLLQDQIKGKAAWAGIPVELVSPSWTSKTCSKCHFVNRTLTTDRSWLCPNCGCQHDRDLNAAVNVVSRSKLGCLAMVPPEAGGA